MATSPLGKGLVISVGAIGGALLGFWLQDRWMIRYREQQRERVRQIIKEEQEAAVQEQSMEFDSAARTIITDDSIDDPKRSK